MTHLILKLLPLKKITKMVAFLAHSNLSLIRYPLIWLFNSIYEPNLNEAREKNLKDYSSLNDFFIRKIKEESRTFDEDLLEIGSPVDGVISSFGVIEEGRLIQAKGIDYSLKDLVASETEYKKFNNGYFLTIYLSPKDYHRIHSPSDGKVYLTEHIPGSLFSVNESSQRSVRDLYAINERTLMGIKNKNFNFMLVNVGAAIVGNIVPYWYNEKLNDFDKIIDSWKLGPEKNLKFVEKGQEIAFFQMGSTVILLFERKLNLNSDYLEELKPVKLGETLFKL